MRLRISALVVATVVSACGSGSSRLAPAPTGTAKHASIAVGDGLAPASDVDLRCTRNGAIVPADPVPVDAPGAVGVRIRNETGAVIVVRLSGGSTGTTDGATVEAGGMLHSSWDVGPGVYQVECVAGGSALGMPAVLTFVGSGPNSGECVGFAVSVAETAVGVGLDAIPSRIRRMISGLRASDEIHAPATTSGPTATWRVTRHARAVAWVTFFHAPGDRGWLAESGSACAGLTIRPS